MENKLKNIQILTFILENIKKLFLKFVIQNYFFK